MHVPQLGVDVRQIQQQEKPKHRQDEAVGEHLPQDSADTRLVQLSHVQQCLLQAE